MITEYVALDAHKRYSLLERENMVDRTRSQVRIEHEKGAIAAALQGISAGTSVALEAVGNWYWIVNEIERIGLTPRLVHPRKAKLMMGMINKTDKLDVHGLNLLQRNGTLPTVWIAPGPLRDIRELTRGRMVLVAQRTRLKNRVLATFAKYAISLDEWSDAFGVNAQVAMKGLIAALPEHTGFVAQTMLSNITILNNEIAQLEQRLHAALVETPEMRLLQTLPAFGKILSAVVMLEVGDIRRFPSAPHLASYSGTTPTVKSSGGKTRFGSLRQDVNRYLKWAFLEAGNLVCLQQRHFPDRHVTLLYQRIRARKGHPKAVGAVARHLAEATFYVLSKQQPYQDPVFR
jgi:transposase